MKKQRFQAQSGSRFGHVGTFYTPRKLVVEFNNSMRAAEIVLALLPQGKEFHVLYLLTGTGHQLDAPVNVYQLAVFHQDCMSIERPALLYLPELYNIVLKTYSYKRLYMAFRYFTNAITEYRTATPAVHTQYNSDFFHELYHSLVFTVHYEFSVLNHNYFTNEYVHEPFKGLKKIEVREAKALYTKQSCYIVTYEEDAVPITSPAQLDTMCNTHLVQCATIVDPDYVAPEVSVCSRFFTAEEAELRRVTAEHMWRL